ncbi:MAG: GNAT family N-acetyltransferase, partial [Jatrophihabitantaceae bacterium]
MLKPSWVGRRVSVRRALERTADGRTLFVDVVGDLLSLDADVAIVEGRHGVVQILTATIAVARLVVASTAEEFALERILAQGWRAEQTAELGGWLFRAASGFTSRANSVLTLGAPGVPLEQALNTARAWYAERALPLRLQIPTE